MEEYAKRFVTCEYSQIIKYRPIDDLDSIYIAVSPFINLYHELLEGIQTIENFDKNTEKIIMQYFENYDNNSPYLLFMGIYYLMRVAHKEISYEQLVDNPEITPNIKLWIISYVAPAMYGWTWEKLLKKEPDLKKWTNSDLENHFTLMMYCHFIYCSNRESFYFERMIENLKESKIDIRKILYKNLNYLDAINYSYDFNILKPFLTELINCHQISIVDLSHSEIIKKIINAYDGDELPHKFKILLGEINFNYVNDHFEFLALLVGKHRIPNNTISLKKYLAPVHNLFPKFLEIPFICESMMKLNIEVNKNIGIGKVCKEGVFLAKKNGWIIPHSVVSISTYCNILRYAPEIVVYPHTNYDDLSEVDADILQHPKARIVFRQYLMKYCGKKFETMPEKLMELIYDDYKKTGERDLVQFLQKCLEAYPENIMKLSDDILIFTISQNIGFYFTNALISADMTHIWKIKFLLNNKKFLKLFIQTVLLEINEMRIGDKLNLLMFLSNL